MTIRQNVKKGGKLDTFVAGLNNGAPLNLVEDGCGAPRCIEQLVFLMALAIAVAIHHVPLENHNAGLAANC